MPDRYLDKFKSNNERKCSKFKETRQNALYLCERTVSFRWCGWVRPSNDRREVASKVGGFWKITPKNVSKNRKIQNLSKVIADIFVCIIGARADNQTALPPFGLANCIWALCDSPCKMHVTGETCPSRGKPLKLQLEIVEPRYKNQLKAEFWSVLAPTLLKATDSAHFARASFF